MEEVKIKVLGISATPVKGGNCDKLVQEALAMAAKLGNVETEFVTTADKKMAMCQHCQWCIENRAPCKIKDDVPQIYDLIKKCDGLILGSPTWLNTLSPPLLILFSRVRYFIFFTHDFRNKVVGAISLGFLGFGKERSLDTIRNVAWAFNMLPVAEAWVFSTTRAKGERPAYFEHGVFDDSWGMKQVEMLSARVVEVARMVKYATQAGITLPEEFKYSITGGRPTLPKERVFVSGVWREK